MIKVFLRLRFSTAGLGTAHMAAFLMMEDPKIQTLGEPSIRIVYGEVHKMQAALTDDVRNVFRSPPSWPLDSVIINALQS